jgi:hypothetical protein
MVNHRRSEKMLSDFRSHFVRDSATQTIYRMRRNLERRRSRRYKRERLARRKLSISVIAASSRFGSFFLYVSSRRRMPGAPVSPHLGLETACAVAGIPLTAVFVISVMPTMIGVPVPVAFVMIPPPIDLLDVI